MALGGGRVARDARAQAMKVPARCCSVSKALAGQRRQVELQVLGIVGQGVFQSFDATWEILSRKVPSSALRDEGFAGRDGMSVSAVGAAGRRVDGRSDYAAVLMTSSPFCQLQGQSSSVCSASSTRSTSCGLRPTLMSVT